MKLTMACFIYTLLIVAGCATHAPMIDWNDTQIIFTHISVTTDNSKELTTYQGPWYNEKEIGGYLLRAWKYAKDENATYQIYIKDHYSDDSGFFGSAYDQDHNKLMTVTISRENDLCIERSCWLHHPLGINVDKEYLKKYKESGISIELFDKTGDTDFFIPPAYIKALLDKVG